MNKRMIYPGPLTAYVTKRTLPTYMYMYGTQVGGYVALNAREQNDCLLQCLLNSEPVTCRIIHKTYARIYRNVGKFVQELHMM